MRRTPGLLLILLSAFPTHTPAQPSPQARPGDLIRVTAPRCSLYEERGQFGEIRADSLVMNIEGTPVSCPVSAVMRTEVFQGKRSWWKPALVGAGVLGVAGAASASHIRACYQEFDEKTNLCPVIGGAVGLFTGFLLGGVFASIRGKEVWEDLPLPLVRASLSPMPWGRFSLGLSLPSRKR